jgi:hypothetical protein
MSRFMQRMDEDILENFFIVNHALYVPSLDFQLISTWPIAFKFMFSTFSCLLLF